MSRRETAWRALVQEITQSTTEDRGEGERAASYVVSPLGLRMNRVLLVGELELSPETSGPDGMTFVRGHLSDPTGTIEVSAGSFQPRTQRQLRTLPTPATALLVGKVRMYRGRDTVPRVSLAPEGVRTIALEEYRESLAEAAEATLARLRVVEAERTAPPNDARATLWRAVDRCVEVLSDPTFGSTGGPGVRGPPPTQDRRVTIHRTPAPAPPPAPTAAERAEESAVLDLVDEIAEPSVDGYADERELLRRAAASGMSGDRAERILARLVAEGALEEPIVGKFRRA